MTWNYRAILHDLGPDAPWIGLHEVYSDGGQITGWTKEAVSFVCDPEEGASGIAEALRQALGDTERLPLLREIELTATLKGARD